MDIESLRELEAAGVRFIIEVPDIGGVMTYAATAEDALLCTTDRNALFAKAHGVSKADYLAWVADDHSVRCHALTSAGRPCRNAILGGRNVSARRWVELQGSSYCVTHEEGVGQ